jgi:hypothetical protein
MDELFAVETSIAEKTVFVGIVDFRVVAVVPVWGISGTGASRYVFAVRSLEAQQPRSAFIVAIALSNARLQIGWIIFVQAGELRRSIVVRASGCVIAPVAHQACDGAILPAGA